MIGAMRWVWIYDGAIWGVGPSHSAAQMEAHRLACVVSGEQLPAEDEPVICQGFAARVSVFVPDEPGATARARAALDVIAPRQES